MNEFSKYIGLDTHKATIAVAVAEGCGGKPRYYGEIANTPEAINKLVKALCPEGERMAFCYEFIDVHGVAPNDVWFKWPALFADESILGA